jgi:hypothetical protein
MTKDSPKNKQAVVEGCGSLRVILEQIPSQFTARILRLRGKERRSAQDAAVNQIGKRYILRDPAL